MKIAIASPASHYGASRLPHRLPCLTLAPTHCRDGVKACPHPPHFSCEKNNPPDHFSLRKTLGGIPVDLDTSSRQRVRARYHFSFSGKCCHISRQKIPQGKNPPDSRHFAPQTPNPWGGRGGKKPRLPRFRPPLPLPRCRQTTPSVFAIRYPQTPSKTASRCSHGSPLPH